MAWPWNKQGIPSSSMNVTAEQRPYFSGDAEIFQPDTNLMGQVPSYTPYTDYSNYRDRIRDMGIPGYENMNALEKDMANVNYNTSQAEFDAIDTGNDDDVPGMGKKAIDYIDSPVNFMMRANHPRRFDPLVNAKNFAQDLPGNIKKGMSGLAGLFRKLPTPMNLIKGAVRNPLDPNSPNFNPILQNQLGAYGDWTSSDEAEGYDPLAGQNLVSGFGSNDVQAQLRKKLAYFQKKKYQSETKTGKMKLIRKAIADQVAAESAGYKGTPGGNVGSGAFAKFDQSGKTYGPYSGGTGDKGQHTTQGGGYTKGAAQGTPGAWSPGAKEGGRIGYAFGEEVGQETDFIQGPEGGEEFQETVVEGQEQPSREQLEALAMEIFQLPLEELDEEQLLVVYQEAMQGQPMEEAVQEEDVQFAAQGGLAGLL
jgi:hypothetical protein